MSEKPSLKQLMNNLQQQGRVEWIGVRAEKRKALTVVDQIVVLENFLEGDHYAGRSGKRSVTLIQAEHIETIQSLLHKKILDRLS